MSPRQAIDLCYVFLFIHAFFFVVSFWKPFRYRSFQFWVTVLGFIFSISLWGVYWSSLGSNPKPNGTSLLITLFYFLGMIFKIANLVFSQPDEKTSKTNEQSLVPKA